MCAIRWVENSSVINSAIDFIPHIKKYIDGVKNKPLQQSKSFVQVSDFVKHDILLAKLHFMLTVTTELEPFLRMFQSNKPLLPFLYMELMNMLKNIMQRFIIGKVMDLAITNTELMQVDIRNKENYIAINKIDVGFSARAQLPGKNERDVLSFLRDCRNFLIVLCERLNLKSPLRKKIVKGFSCLSPDIMLSAELKKSRIQILLSELLRCKQISAVEAENIQRDYLNFCGNDEVKSNLKAFKKSVNRLDTFFMANLKYFMEDCSVQAFFNDVWCFTMETPTPSAVFR